MKPHIYTSEGIVLSKRNYGEADKILTIFSSDFGKISVIAKGIRRPKSKKRGSIEIFNKIKFQCATGSTLDILIEAVVLDNYPAIKLSMNRVSLAYYVSEVVAKITNDNEPNPEIYYLLGDSLEKIEKTNLLKDLRLKFINDLLVITGYHPENEDILDHSKLLNSVIERSLNTERVAKRMLLNS